MPHATRKEVLISGFGGQGVLKAGRVLGYAAVLAGLKATMLASHGTETRGGYVRSQVVISDEAIDNPVTERPDIFCALSQAAYDRFRFLADKGLIVYDQDVVVPELSPGAAVLALPARRLAAGQAGSELSANFVALGAVLRRLPLVPLEYGLQSVREILPRHGEINARALEIGYHFPSPGERSPGRAAPGGRSPGKGGQMIPLNHNSC
ncbi:MAG: 2-oxoacid:acceptor oxidoreductase family protein [Deltaproteobacteria bacterium]|nr:2-oxoacid:acceptor oxidoreductase family protein [Deltaproteobacteria bacterium]